MKVKDFLSATLVYEHNSHVNISELKNLYKKDINLDSIYSFIISNYLYAYDEEEKNVYKEAIKNDQLLVNFSLRLPNYKEFYEIESWTEINTNEKVLINSFPYSFQTEDLSLYISSYKKEIPQKLFYFGNAFFYLIGTDKKNLNSILNYRKESPLTLGLK